ncbi:ATP-binding cassette domain-containing protein [Halomonas sp. DP5Y7-2]|uniref:ABC transporter ATP-binding protein n=1 Tax=Halomonas sp. DP5Y7-2 TaxID=2859076 RepID=UPI001C9A01FD|nr:ATP-binding cassette domain-containing protein [Halomonas sp. DP5Y7-2]MBY5983221.1 ATP-binding cassette domain-containing protein [Halomonas sp. DP5Y7-2]
MARTLAIEAKDLSKTFHPRKPSKGIRQTLSDLVVPRYSDIQALRGIHMTIEYGRCVGLLGANGAGKSTLVKLMCGIQTPTSGTLSVLGERPNRRSHSFLRRLGVVFGHKSSLWWDLPVADSLDAYARIYRLDRAAYRSERAQLVECLNIGHVIDKPVRVLSLGERVKSELVASLIHRPTLVFLDEPTIGLDVAARYELREYLKQRTQSGHLTSIITSHDMNDIETCCQEVVLIDGGRVLHQGSITSLKKALGTGSSISIILPDRPFTSQDGDRLRQLHAPQSMRSITLTTSGALHIVAPDHDSQQRILADVYAFYPNSSIQVSDAPLEDAILQHFLSSETPERRSRP